MSFTLVFNSAIESDLTDIYDYYELQLPGLGSDFLLSVDATLNYIQREPLHFQKIYRNNRKANLRRFPYGVFFLLSKETIYILTVTHLTRNPKIWKSRKP